MSKEEQEEQEKMRQEAIRQAERERRDKYKKQEEEREGMRQTIREKVIPHHMSISCILLEVVKNPPEFFVKNELFSNLLKSTITSFSIILKRKKIATQKKTTTTMKTLEEAPRKLKLMTLQKVSTF